MSQTIYIGVDGGGTRTRVRIENKQRVRLGEGVSGPANIRLSVPGAWKSILTALQAALHQAGIHTPIEQLNLHAGLGLAGCEVNEAQEAFLNTPHHFRTISLKSDAHTACLGAHLGKDGAMIIIGTGVVAYQIEKGRVTKVGGWGFPQDDEGSGAWLGLQAIRAAFHAYDGRLSKSPMTDSILTRFKNDASALSAWADEATPGIFATLAPMVIEYAQHGDPIAITLMQQAGNCVSHLAEVMLRQQKSLLPCAVSGGISQQLIPWLREDIRERLSPCLGDAMEGALMMIRHEEACGSCA